MYNVGIKSQVLKQQKSCTGIFYSFTTSSGYQEVTMFKKRKKEENNNKKTSQYHFKKKCLSEGHVLYSRIKQTHTLRCLLAAY